MYRVKFARLAVATSCLCVVVSASAQDGVEEVVVRASPLGGSADDLSQPVVVLSRDELLLKAQQSIGETLAGELGVSSSYFGPVAGRPVIRGQGGPRVSVLEDGVSSLDVADVSPDHAVPVEALLADQIEVIRGPATLLYGSTAAGGVVNVIDNRIPTEHGDKPVTGAMEFRGDTAAEERALVGRVDGSAGSFAWHADGFWRETDDIEIAEFGTAVAADRPADEPRGRLINSFGESQGFAGGVSFIGTRGYLGVSLARYENEYGLPGPEEEESGAGAEAMTAGPFIDLEQDRLAMRGKLELDTPLEELRLRFARNDYEHVEIEPSGEVATRFENDAWEMRVEALHAPLGNWRGALGLQLTGREFSATGEEAFVLPVNTDVAGVFLIEEYERDAVHVDVGARVETLEHDTSGSLADYDETALSVAAGVVWSFASQYDMSLNLSRSERNAAIEELYSNGPHLATGLFEVGLLASGNTGVEQETATNLDVALHYHGRVVDWQVGVFRNDVSDYIFLATGTELEDGLPLANYLQRDAEFYGYEAELLFTVSGAEGEWDSRLFTDYVRGKTDGGDLPRIQPRRFGAELGYTANRWRAGVTAVWHAQQDEISSFQTDAFTLLGADFVFDLDTKGPASWQFFAKASNLLDEDARRAASFRAAFVPLPGVSLHAGARVRFE